MSVEHKTKETKKPKVRLHPLDKSGWRKPRPDGKKGYVYKVLVCPCGGEPPKLDLIWRNPDGMEPQELWITEEEADLAWLQKQVGGNIETLPAIEEIEDGHLVAVFNEDGIGLKLPRNYLVGQFLEHMSEPYYGTALVMPIKLLD